jgi:hypothetical protein
MAKAWREANPARVEAFNASRRQPPRCLRERAGEVDAA